MSRTASLLCSLALAGALGACGGRSLDVPESLDIVDYPASTALTLSFVMKSCSDPCSTYEAPTCTVEQGEGATLLVSVSVPYSANDAEACSLVCGPPVLAHCSAPALAAGDWTVESGTFSTTIHIH